LDCLAYLVLTSGSTGAPKPVAVTHRSIADATRIHCRGYRLTASDRGSWLSPPGSSVSVGELWPFLSAGASVHVADQDVVSSPEALRDWLVAHRITVAYAGMPLAEALYTLPWPADCALRLLVVGSDTVRTWASASLPFEVAVSIGSAEANAISSCLSPWDQRVTSKTASRARLAALPPVGRPWPGVRTHVLDDDLRPLPIGEIGQLHVASSQLARGYVGDPRRTAAAFVPNPFADDPGERLYRTGDLVRVDEDGVIEHCGRADGQVKIDGQRVAPAEVERHLLAHPDVTEAVVVARQDPSGRQRLVAYLTGGQVPAATMRGFVAGRLPVPSVPTAYVHLDTVPRNVNGKIDRRMLPEPLWQPDDQRHDRHHGDEIDRAVADSWRSALNVDQVAADDDFYLMGGDSLAGNKIVRELNRRFGLRLTVRAVLMRPTPGQLANVVRSAIGRRDD
jgi:acyl-coenzyme A synthetase/AMP-(fatty) acid ligase